MKKVILISFIISTLSTITAFSIDIPWAEKYVAYNADYTIEIDGKEHNSFLYPVVSIEDKAYIALTDFASSTGRIATWLPEQNKIRVAEGNKDMTKELIIYEDEVTGNQGFKDSAGNIIIEAKDEYSHVHPFCEGLAMVCDARRIHNKPLYGFINQKGEMVIPQIYTIASDFHNGITVVTTSFFRDDWHFIKKDGSLLFDKKFKWADDFSEGFACILTQGEPHPTPDDSTKRYSYIDLNGEPATDLEFEKVSRFKNGYANVTLNGVDGYIDTQFNFYEGER